MPQYRNSLLLSALAAPVSIAYERLSRRRFIGVVVFIDHAASQDGILWWADKAICQEKAAGRNAIRFYAEEALVAAGKTDLADKG